MDAVIAAPNDRTIEGVGTTEAEWLGWPRLSQLPALTASEMVPRGARAVVVAPHPDDEILAVGGLLAHLARNGTPVLIVAVTDGTASHVGSTEWPKERLVRERPQESRTALHRLGIDTEPVRLGLPDGQIEAYRDVLAERLAPLLTADDVIFTTWRRDGHPDHEATGDACAMASLHSGARLIEVPVWAWHWANPSDSRLPWCRARRVVLDADAASRKRNAVQAFTSQLLPDPSTGAGPILRSTTVARASRPFEVVFE
ncbi:PIG-L family deacetylase [soil metagenome]